MRFFASSFDSLFVWLVGWEGGWVLALLFRCLVDWLFWCFFAGAGSIAGPLVCSSVCVMVCLLGRFIVCLSVGRAGCSFAF